MNFSVDFKFCGGCNSRYDRKMVYDSIRNVLQGKVVNNACYKDTVLIILNGCQRGCISSKKFENLYDNIVNTQDYLVNWCNRDLNGITDWIIDSIPMK
ncbi:MAG: hypothetical protein PWQ37_2376 [Candidatus Petromonas sp.]|jgi:hypothetical protein|nr:hypothetical protein [Candidatus Petromonas sp.]